ncbi:Hcp family type VI secretion system effector [Winslowiella iniecta]|uniref:Hcp1 family type VI secretion system effector n=1 Tax=Winslowiella iniecta TaxID=1560201 RepID=A0A0L7T6X8_9GAMM|nr:type VI secretion system tube protein Hcp [Winslowiella iniecta]KOC91137.1 hypothetical protein NG42_06765 [Winslowiella iniecta]KOC93726.1 hypothetical protein NG43_08375 [Winslowiella iniecta]
MNTDIYMKIDNIQGESQDANHKGWIKVSSFNWGATQPANINVGGGGGTGRVQYQDLQVHAEVDKATPAIMRYLSNGKHINKVELSACHASDGQIEYLRITLEEVLITGASYNGTSHTDKIGMSYKFQAAKVGQQYWELMANGGKGPETASGWHIKENRET